jgi:hypothetical protein
MCSFITCILHQIKLQWSSQGEWDGQGMQHAWGREKRNAYTILVTKPEGKTPMGSLDASAIILQEVLGRTTRLLSLTRHRPHWKRRVQQFFYCCRCIRYRGNVSTEPLPIKDRGIFTEPSRYLATIGGYTYRHTDWWEGLFNYAVEMGSGAVIYIPSFIEIGSGVQKLIGWIHRHTQTATWSHKPTLGK